MISRRTERLVVAHRPPSVTDARRLAFVVGRCSLFAVVIALAGCWHQSTQTSVEFAFARLQPLNIRGALVARAYVPRRPAHAFVWYGNARNLSAPFTPVPALP